MSRKDRLRSDTAPASWEHVEAGLEHIGQLDELDAQTGTEGSAEQGIRVVVFDEQGPVDLGHLSPPELHEVIALSTGEPLQLPPIGEVVLPDETPSPIPEPRSRMDAGYLAMRVRISPKWAGRCPKQPGSTAEANWHLYVDGMTVSAFLASHDRRRARADLRWDVDHEFVYLQSPHDYDVEQAAGVEAAADAEDE
jgi:hypothetical protein